VILLATLTTLVPYAYSAAAELVMFFTDRERFELKRFTLHSVVALLAFAYSIWAIYGAGTDVIAKGFILLMVGVPVYVFLKWRQVAAGESTTPVEPVPHPRVAA